MKTEINKPDQFRAVTVTITLESQKELNAFTALFNHAWITDGATRAGLPDLFDAISDKLAAQGGEASGEAWKEIDAHLKKKVGAATP